MILKFFRSSFVIQYVVIIAIALFLWLPSFIQPPEIVIFPEILNPLYILLFGSLQQSPFLLTLIAFLLLVFQAILFNSILSANLLIPRISSVGAFVYILIFSLFKSQTELYPFLVANIFILGAVHTLFLIYNTKNNVELYIFNASVMISLASLFYMPVVILLLWIWVCLVIIRNNNIREWIIPIIGFLLPYFLYATYYFLTDSLISKCEVYQQEFHNLRSLPIYDLTWSETISIIWVLIIFVFAINFTSSNHIEKSIAIRKKISIAYFLFIFSIPVIFFSAVSITHSGLFLITPAIIISILFANIKKSRFINIMLVILFILLVVNNYQNLFSDVFAAKIFR